MPDAAELIQMNLEVFSERDPEKRRAGLEGTDVEDLRVIDSDSEAVGRDARNDRADTAVQPWRFGPPGSPVVRGIDVLTVRDGRVSVVRTLIGYRAEA